MYASCFLVSEFLIGLSDVEYRFVIDNASLHTDDARSFANAELDYLDKNPSYGIIQ